MSPGWVRVSRDQVLGLGEAEPMSGQQESVLHCPWKWSVHLIIDEAQSGQEGRLVSSSWINGASVSLL